VEVLRHPGQFSSNYAQSASFELDAYVDMLGDLHFNTDFDLDLNPVDLSFNGEGLGFASSTVDHLFSLPVRGSGGSSNPSNLTDLLPSPHLLQPQDNTRSYEIERGPNASLSWDISNLSPDEHHLIQHYLATMTGYAKVDDYPRSANSLYTTAFSQSHDASHDFTGERNI
jgi:hypothetical protein